MSNKNFCCTCQRNPCCCCIGPTGPQGPTGPASGFESAYGTFIGTQARYIQPNTLVPLDAVLSDPPVGIMFTPGSTTVTVLNSGTYKITYTLPAPEFALRVNGADLPNSALSYSPLASPTTGIATVTLAAGSTVGISSIGGTLPGRTNAILDVERIR